MAGPCDDPIGALAPFLRPPARTWHVLCQNVVAQLHAALPPAELGQAFAAWGQLRRAMEAEVEAHPPGVALEVVGRGAQGLVLSVSGPGGTPYARKVVPVREGWAREDSGLCPSMELAVALLSTLPGHPTPPSLLHPFRVHAVLPAQLAQAAPVPEVRDLAVADLYLVQDMELMSCDLGRYLGAAQQRLRPAAADAANMPWGTIAVDVRQAATFLAELGEAVGYLHARHLLHSDIKPANIMVGQPDQVGLRHLKLADLAGGSALDPGTGSVSLWRVMRTPMFCRKVAAQDPTSGEVVRRLADDRFAVGLVGKTLVLGFQLEVLAPGSHLNRHDPTDEPVVPGTAKPPTPLVWAFSRVAGRLPLARVRGLLRVASLRERRDEYEGRLRDLVRQQFTPLHPGVQLDEGAASMEDFGRLAAAYYSLALQGAGGDVALGVLAACDHAMHAPDDTTTTEFVATCRSVLGECRALPPEEFMVLVAPAHDDPSSAGLAEAEAAVAAAAAAAAASGDGSAASWEQEEEEEEEEEEDEEVEDVPPSVVAGTGEGAAALGSTASEPSERSAVEPEAVAAAAGRRRRRPRNSSSAGGARKRRRAAALLQEEPRSWVVPAVWRQEQGATSAPQAPVPGPQGVRARRARHARAGGAAPGQRSGGAPEPSAAQGGGAAAVAGPFVLLPPQQPEAAPPTPPLDEAAGGPDTPSSLAQTAWLASALWSWLHNGQLLPPPTLPAPPEEGDEVEAGEGGSGEGGPVAPGSPGALVAPHPAPPLDAPPPAAAAASSEAQAEEAAAAAHATPSTLLEPPQQEEVAAGDLPPPSAPGADGEAASRAVTPNRRRWLRGWTGRRTLLAVLAGPLLAAAAAAVVRRRR